MFCSCEGRAIKYGRYCAAEEQRWRCTSCGRIFTQDRRNLGNNFLPGSRRAELKRLLVAGVPKRAAARAIGVSLQTVTRYYDLWEITAACPCGQPSTHQGFCSWRVKMAPHRQSWLDNRWSKRSKTDIARLVREGSQGAEANGHQIGTWVWAADADAGLWPWTKCLICGCGLSLSDVPGVGKEPHVTGKALVVKCVPPDVLAEHKMQRKALRQEKREWQNGKRTLQELRVSLRPPNSRTRASRPAPSSRG